MLTYCFALVRLNSTSDSAVWRAFSVHKDWTHYSFEVAVMGTALL